jgi:hypothetical protein
VGVCDVAESCDGVSAACPADGFASPTKTCRSSAGPCDVAEACTGNGPDCPPDGLASGVVCHSATSTCDTTVVCDGSTPSCNVPPPPPAGSCTPVSAGSNKTVSLDDHQSVPGDITVNFTAVGSGNVTITETASSGLPPPTGYEFVTSTLGQLRQWDFSTTASYSGTITICIHYASPGEVTQAQKPNLQLVHDDGKTLCPAKGGGMTPWCDISLPFPFTDPTKNVICGSTTSLSPFALLVPVSTPPTLTVPPTTVAEATGPGGAAVSYVATAVDDEDGSLSPICTPASGATFPLGDTQVGCTVTDSSGLTATASFTVTVLDTTGPVLTGVPASPVIAYATSAAGAKVTWAAPAAIDAVDGPEPVTCAAPSGATFPLGTTTVTCTTADSRTNSSSRPFTVQVQVQAPRDGTFFAQPINPDGSSIFKAGSTIPVKFQLTGASAASSNLTAHILVAHVSNGVMGTYLEATTNGAADSGNLFRYDDTASQYVYNLSTKGMATGTWSLRADLGDGVDHSIRVSLK